MIKKDIVFCIVNFNQEEKTIKNLKNKLQFFYKIEFTYYVHVIDNGSSIFPKRLKVFCEKNNLQFDFLKSNYGVVRALNTCVTKFYNHVNLFIRDDNDIFYDLNNVDSFNLMIKFVVSEKVSVCGPKVLDKLGKFQSGRIQISKFGFNSKRTEYSQTCSTDTILGCYMILNFTTISGLESLFSENIKFGCEELELTLRLRKAGKIIQYFPFFHIFHHHGMTTQYSEKSSSFTNYLLIRNNEVVLSKYSNFYINFLRKIYFLSYHFVRAIVKNDSYFLNAYFSGIIKNKITDKEWDLLVG